MQRPPFDFQNGFLRSLFKLGCTLAALLGVLLSSSIFWEGQRETIPFFASPVEMVNNHVMLSPGASYKRRGQGEKCANAPFAIQQDLLGGE